jgi:hypothetical protein
MKVFLIISIIFLMTQLFAYIYLKACEKNEGTKRGWERIMWHTFITFSFPVYLMNISIAPKKEGVLAHTLLSLFIFLVGYFLISFIVVGLLTLTEALLAVFCFFITWFLVAYVVGGIIQGARNGTLFEP